MAYIHLQVRSGYSLMNSTITIDKLINKAKELQFPALALTDEGVLYGAVSFYRACMRAGIKPILGLIVPLLADEQGTITNLTLLAKDYTGYHQLMRLSTLLQVEDKAALSTEEIREQATGLIGIIPVQDTKLRSMLGDNNFQDVKDYLQSFEELFGKEDFYIGVEQSGITASLLKAYADTYPTNITVITDVHYLEEKDVYSYDCLLAMRSGRQWNMQLSTPELKGKHLRTEQEVELELGELFPEAIHESEKIAAKCSVEMDFTKRYLPTFPLEGVTDAHTYLKEQCMLKLKEKYDEPTKEIKERLAYELSVIKTMDFSDYFLITADIIAYAKQKGIVVGPGRGSSAGSLVAYTLGITDVDPIKYDLLFERFLNPERQTMPDIDIDFSDERRDEVIAYVRGKYGTGHVAQIITFGTFAARSLIRELIKTLDVEQQDARFILKEIGSQPSNSIVEMMKGLPELAAYIKQSTKLKLLFQVAISLEGLPRHISTHAAGVVISERPLLEHTPLTTGAGETYLTQFAMNDLEAIGLLKMDFLGLRNLSLLERVVQSVNYVRKGPLRLEAIPVWDNRTFQILREGRTNGVFQLESEGMKRVLRELQPTDFEDIVAVNALYRPGPMDFIPTYIARKNGEQATSYPHQDLKPILESTYGVLVYQEQIMQIASRIAGFSLGEADILRRAVSKKNHAAMEEEHQAFTQGCMSNGYTMQVAEEIFSWIVRFSNYGFPRSHAVAYSKISYQLSYLKANYPANFFAEILSAARNQQDKIQLYLKEMSEMGLELLPPSINQSFGKYSVEKGQIRMGLHSIKGISRDAIWAIIETRRKAPFKNLFDFCLRVPTETVKRSTIENLILAGAFDDLYDNRASLLASIDQAMEQGELFREFYDQPNLFENQLSLEGKYVEIEDFTVAKKLQDEKELLGMYISSHPLKNYRTRLRASGYLQLAALKHVLRKNETKIVVIVQEIKQIRTKRGEQMAFLVIADEQDTLDAVIFPDTYREVKRWLEEEQLITITGRAEERNGRLQFVAQEMELFKEEELEQASGKVIFIKSTEETNPEALNVIDQVAKEHPGSAPIILYNEVQDQSYKLKENYFLYPTHASLNKLRDFFGKDNVVMRKA
ncbi:DNA polymerase III subunit alpha [Oceanobacillus alkalisoli]|uniref:DNA polymerase III subunit alpha n=1 Tax=Oceanobacillus alkalisoli TaxID=2925113 RepID=UPI001EE4259D|nr:DNA polymerase III subunit alpha [Oceanobacillus alkalisoli]MCG5105292.1 DNA polymerase III subunit alpha [Oceanobacillus alkalisoli]